MGHSGVTTAAGGQPRTFALRAKIMHASKAICMDVRYKANVNLNSSISPCEFNNGLLPIDNMIMIQINNMKYMTTG